MFCLIHGIGQQYFVKIDEIACVACHLGTESGNVEADITFSGGAVVKIAATGQMWEQFLAVLPLADTKGSTRS